MCYDCKQNTLLSENFRKFGKAALDMLYKCPLISTAWTKKMQIKIDTVSRHSSIFCYIRRTKRNVILTAGVRENMQIKDMSRQNYFKLSLWCL